MLPINQAPANEYDTITTIIIAMNLGSIFADKDYSLRPESLLPPIRNALKHPFMRSNYQANQCMEADNITFVLETLMQSRGW